MSTPDQYPVFVTWYKALSWILDRVEGMPKHMRYSFNNRIASLAMDVQAGIINAIYTKERRPILLEVNLNLEHLRILFRMSYERKLISEKQYAFISGEINETGKMIGGWMS